MFIGHSAYLGKQGNSSAKSIPDEERHAQQKKKGIVGRNLEDLKVNRARFSESCRGGGRSANIEARKEGRKIKKKKRRGQVSPETASREKRDVSV